MCDQLRLKSIKVWDTPVQFKFSLCPLAKTDLNTSNKRLPLSYRGSVLFVHEIQLNFLRGQNALP